MNPLVQYAKLSASFQNLYRQRDPNYRYTIAIASAISGLLIINIWTLVLLASFVDHGWFASRRRVGPFEFAGLSVGLFIVQMILVDLVLTKIDRDQRFASRVAPASPRISMWYGGVSAVLLVVSTILKLGIAS